MPFAPISEKPCSHCGQLPRLEKSEHGLCFPCALEGGPSRSEQGVGMRYTQAVLEAAFDAVRNPEHWKGEIDTVLSEEALTLVGGWSVVYDAIIHFTGTVGELTCSTKGNEIKAPGYWAGPCN